MPKSSANMEVKEGKEVAARAKADTKMKTDAKIKFCMYHLQGVCKYSGNECAFAHSTEEMHSSRGGRKGRNKQGGKEETTMRVENVKKNTSTPGSSPPGPSSVKGESDWPTLAEPAFVPLQPPRASVYPVCVPQVSILPSNSLQQQLDMLSQALGIGTANMEGRDLQELSQSLNRLYSVVGKITDETAQAKQDNSEPSAPKWVDYAKQNYGQYPLYPTSPIHAGVNCLDYGFPLPPNAGIQRFPMAPPPGLSCKAIGG